MRPWRKPCSAEALRLIDVQLMPNETLAAQGCGNAQGRRIDAVDAA
jgi:hypothetical protein